jgi:hypothetical protein
MVRTRVRPSPAAGDLSSLLIGQSAAARRVTYTFLFLANFVPNFAQARDPQRKRSRT